MNNEEIINELDIIHDFAESGLNTTNSYYFFRVMKALTQLKDKLLKRSE